jgi:hypothetical protein
MGFPQLYIQMTQLLFRGAQTRVSLNERCTQPFAVERGVRQGCPLAPYLFLIIGEVLNACIKKEVQMGHIERIHLPGAQEQQTVMQFADDTSMTIASEERTVTNTISTLHSFSLASGLLLNWDKSIAYWWDPRGGPRPGWSLNLEVQWAELGDISKLLGTPFGLSLSADDVDQFLIEKIDKKLKYWITTRINNTGRAVVANGILISTALFFLAIWEGGGVG